MGTSNPTAAANAVKSLLGEDEAKKAFDRMSAYHAGIVKQVMDKLAEDPVMEALFTLAGNDVKDFVRVGVKLGVTAATSEAFALMSDPRKTAELVFGDKVDDVLPGGSSREETINRWRAINEELQS